MNKFFTRCCILLFLAFTSGVFAQTYFTEDFESGFADTSWGVFYIDPTTQEPEDSVVAVPMAQAPEVLATGGSYVGWLQDTNFTYQGSAVAINGSTSLANYSIEADVYCYVNNSGGSAYTGLVVYADTTKHDFYKLRADFDASDRINFSGLKSDPITYMPLFSHDFTGTDNPGIFPTSDGWHKMKIEVNSQNPDSTAFWCYFDGNLLTGCPIYDTTSSRNTSGSFGLYTFQMDGDGIPGYFDNLVVAQSPWTSVDNKSSNIPEGYALEQNYPNPFNPETRISYQLNEGGFTSLTVFNLLGSEIKTLVTEEQPAGSYSVTWDGTDELGNKMPSGIYFYALRSGNFVATKKMIMMK